MENTPTNGAKPPEETIGERLEREIREGKFAVTPMGRKLLDARLAIERSGIPMLNEEELEREKAERRG